MDYKFRTNRGQTIEEILKTSTRKPHQYIRNKSNLYVFIVVGELV